MRAADQNSPRSPWPRRVGVVVGVGLLIGAIVVVIGRRDEIAAPLAALRQPRLDLLALLALGVVANILGSGIIFELITSRYGPVGWIEMQAVMAAATLANFLPLRAGMFGRMAYHARYNHIRPVHAFKAMLLALMLTGAVGTYLILIVIIAGAASWPLWPLLLLPAPGVFLALKPTWRLWVVAATVRYVEVLVWGVRYWCAFELIDHSIAFDTALVFACISIVATLVPVFSNGLGIREWAVGLATPLLLGTEATLADGLAADLVNRAMELLVIPICGIAGFVWIGRHRHREKTVGGHGESDPPALSKGGD